jgi:hypothetical protein
MQEVVVYVSSSANNLVLSELFNGGDWGDADKRKRVVINSGVTVGSTSAADPAIRTGTGRAEDLVIENHGIIAGAGGAANGGAGGNALLVEQAGVSVVNSGTIAGGGGGGGKGGRGGDGSYSSAVREPASGEYYSANTETQPDESYFGVVNLFGNWSTTIWWQGSKAYNVATQNYGSITVGSYKYYRGTLRDSAGLYAVYRTHDQTLASTGGTGGDGARGQGSDGAAESGLAGTTGGTNAGTGGTGGAGGTYGMAGSSGTAGTSGNVSAGLGGGAGGAAGAAIAGSGYTLTNTGTVLGNY